MMKSNLVMIGNVPIGEGIPKICIPLVAKTKEELVDEARGLMDAVGDLVEWRADWYESLKRREVFYLPLKPYRNSVKRNQFYLPFVPKRKGRRSL